ncbi:MAG TPA: hypothetical protein DCQ34_04295 [Chitinophagaceae bacterium]|nr:hypothetical protein [Chitinophagaceae bacterium]
MIARSFKFLASALVVMIYSCTGSTDKRPETAMDTGREFIRASLNGDFKKAEELILKDSQNVQLFDMYKSLYQRLPEDKKKHYRDASYEINKYLDVDDSTTIINYSNDYMNKPMDIKIIRHNNLWQVDFKYAYSGNLPID